VKYTTKAEIDLIKAIHELDPLPPISPLPSLDEISDPTPLPEGEVLAHADVLPDLALSVELPDSRRVSVDEDSLSIDSSTSMDGAAAEAREKILVIELNEHGASGIQKSFMLRSNVEGVVKSWYDDLKWRVQAHHHIKYDWVSRSSGSEDESSQI
jgi:hypothetical protein